MRPSVEYFAGFFDGEGSVHIREKAKTCRFILTIQVDNTNAEVLYLFKKFFGGKVGGPYKRGRKWKPIYKWVVAARRAENFLKQIQEHLIVKSKQCELALLLREKWVPLSRGPGWNRHPEKDLNELKRRQEISDRLRIVNKRGAVEHISAVGSGAESSQSH